MLESVTHQTQPILLHAERDYALGTWRGLFVVIFSQQTTLEGVAKLQHAFGSFARSVPWAGLLTIVEEDAPLPGSEERAALANFMNANGGSIKRSGVVFEGTGFRSAAVRGVVTGLTLLARQPFPHRLFATAEEAATWFAENDAHWVGSKAELAAGVSALRSLYHERLDE